MKSVKPKLKRRGGGCMLSVSEAGGDRVEDVLSDEIGKVKEGHLASSEIGQKDDTQPRNQDQLEELKLAKRKLELELRELELEKREQLLKLSEEKNKKGPRKLFSRQIREIDENIATNRTDGTSRASDLAKRDGDVPDQEEKCERKSVKEDVRISELHDVVRKQQEILDKFQEEREEEKLSMKLIAELLLKEQSKQHQQKKDEDEPGNWRQGKNDWKRSMNSGFVRGREANVKKGVSPQSERSGNGYGRPRTEQERSRLKDKTKDSGRQKTGYDRRHYNISVSVTGEGVNRKHLHPLGMFRDAGLCLPLLKNIDKCCYMEPTPVQQYAIPLILDGRDMMACAHLGAGKTAAYLIPIIQMLMKSDSVYRSGQYQPASPTALVIAPTRELVIQVFDEAKKLSKGSMVKPAVLYGGTNPHYQAKDLTEGCNILVATLGRLMDFVDRGIVSLRKVKILVLDEADKLLDWMGSMCEIEKCVDAMPGKRNRQTLMFSGSFPADFQTVAQDYMHDYLFLTLGRVDPSKLGIVQKVYNVDMFDKREKLMELILDPARDPRERLLIFAQTKKNAEFLDSHLSLEGFPVTCIHGGMKQEDREKALDEYRIGVKSILVATGVAARGLSGLNVVHVINYDMVDDMEDYLARIDNIEFDDGKVSSFIDVARDYDLDFDQFSKLMTAEEATALEIISREARRFKEADED